jgi:hypothetical protein
MSKQQGDNSSSSSGSSGIDYSKWDHIREDDDDEEEEKCTPSFSHHPRNHHPYRMSYDKIQQVLGIQGKGKNDKDKKDSNKNNNDNDTFTVIMMEEMVNDIDDMLGKNVTRQTTTTTAAAAATGMPPHLRAQGNRTVHKDSNALLQNIVDAMGQGKTNSSSNNKNVVINRLTTSDYYSATALLHMVTPQGMAKRMQARAIKGDGECHLFKDPVHIYLWSLTMKLREGPQHVHEVLQHNVFARLLSVMEATRLHKYRGLATEYATIATEAQQDTLSVRPATRKENLVAKELYCDICDIISCTAVLHEICRYREGCVQLASEQGFKCLHFLFHQVPTEDMVQIAGNLTLLDHGERKAEEHNANWQSLLSYHPGMIEQGTIDTVGRLLNGLIDQHPQLCQKVAKKVKQTAIPSLERKVQTIEIIKSMMGPLDSKLFHCIDVHGSMIKLKSLVTSILHSKKTKGKKTTTPWESMFLIDRAYIDNPKNIGQVDDKIGNKRNCHFCQNEPKGNIQMCSRW